MNIEAIGFDLDHTLLVPNRERSAILQEATERINGPSIDRDEYLDAHKHHLTGQTREPIFAELLQTKNTTVTARELTETYRALINEAVTLIPNCLELLERLRENYSVGLLTNGPQRAQREKIARFNLEAYFDAIVISGEIHAGKPEPAAFNTLSEKLGVTPHKSVFVGDQITTDIEGGLRAGFSVIQVYYPNGPNSDDRALAHVDRETLSTELPQVLERLDEKYEGK